jgi:hypothetical protein
MTSSYPINNSRVTFVSAGVTTVIEDYTIIPANRLIVDFFNMLPSLDSFHRLGIHLPYLKEGARGDHLRTATHSLEWKHGSLETVVRLRFDLTTSPPRTMATIPKEGRIRFVEFTWHFDAVSGICDNTSFGADIYIPAPPSDFTYLSKFGINHEDNVLKLTQKHTWALYHFDIAV